MRFRYLAATSSNERNTGWIEAPSLQMAAAELRQNGLFIIRLEEESVFARMWTALNQEIHFRSPLRRGDLVGFSQEWAGLLEAGISVEESLALLVASARPSVAAILSRVRDEVTRGATLYAALARYPSCFPLTYVTLVQAGEIAGSLGPTLRRLADDLSMQQSVVEDVRNALLYPAFLLVTAIIGISTLLVVVVPNLEDLFGSRSLETLPLTTRIIIAASHFLRDQGAPLILALSLLGLLTAGFARTSYGRLWLHRSILKMPAIGHLVQAVETGRFTRACSALLKGGVGIPRAMPLAIDTISNQAMRKHLEQAYERIMIGTAVGDALAMARILPHDAVGFVRMGERTGQLDMALERAALLYEGRAARRLKILTTLITPSLTILFGLLAGMIIYAMLSTILSINDLAASQ